MFWELMQQAQISRAHSAALNARSVAASAQEENRYLKIRIEHLEETVERLSLMCMAVAEIVRDRVGVSQQEIEAKVQEIDLRDGKLDGRLRSATCDCTHCRHTNAPHRRNRLYCGETLPATSTLFPAPRHDADDVNDERH